MFANLSKHNIILGSNSPRRQQLLSEIGVDFTVISPQGDETYPNDLASHEVAEYLARKKASWFTQFDANQLYITADTVVVIDNEILGKPTDQEDAFKLLSKLSGHKHQVITGVCIKTKEQTISFSSTTDVFFKTLTQEQIAFYIENFKPFDKAGSYGIQEWIGMIGIDEIKGSYFNVMGLPTSELFAALQKM